MIKIRLSVDVCLDMTSNGEIRDKTMALSLGSHVKEALQNIDWELLGFPVTGMEWQPVWIIYPQSGSELEIQDKQEASPGPTLPANLTEILLPIIQALKALDCRIFDMEENTNTNAQGMTDADREFGDALARLQGSCGI